MATLEPVFQLIRQESSDESVWSAVIDVVQREPVRDRQTTPPSQVIKKVCDHGNPIQLQCFWHSGFVVQSGRYQEVPGG